MGRKLKAIQTMMKASIRTDKSNPASWQLLCDACAAPVPTGAGKCPKCGAPIISVREELRLFSKKNIEKFKRNARWEWSVAGREMSLAFSIPILSAIPVLVYFWYAGRTPWHERSTLFLGIVMAVFIVGEFASARFWRRYAQRIRDARKRESRK
jgi:ribosomal protein L40E